MEQAAFLFLFMFLACTTTVVQCTNKSIFILAGQSNMVGEGGILDNGTWDGIVPPECQSNPQILRLNNDSQWEIAKEPLHEGIRLKPQHCGVGPGMSFATATLKPGETIGLVPCAIVASYLDEWKRGTSYYNRTLDRARAAVSNGGGSIRALLWYQGESDTINEANAKSYKSRVEQFFTDFRNDLRLPSLPIIQVAVITGQAYIKEVREAQLNTRLPNVYTVDAQKLNATLIQNIHLDTMSQVKLGKALADAFRNISALHLDLD